jgi:tRNA threonylcarbamoyladenosine biosynthesis protein TsaE
MIIPNEAAMLEFGQRLAVLCSQPVVIYLRGELGAGKTTLVRGFLQGLGYEGIVKSPTYTLVEPYELHNKKIFHFDLYRLTHADELLDIGIEDYFNQNAICLIEWPDRGQPWIASADLCCEIQILTEGREVVLNPLSVQGQAICDALRS